MRESNPGSDFVGVRLIKLRPVCRAPGHIGDLEWTDLLETCGMAVAGNIPRLRYPSENEYKPYVSWLLDELRVPLEIDRVVFDVCMSSDNRALDFCLESLSRALEELPEVEKNRLRILVVTGLPGRRPGGIFDLLDHQIWEGRLWVLTTDGSLHGGTQSPFHQLALKLRPMIDPDSSHVCLRQVRANLLRVRGVFEDSSAPGKYFGHRYILDKDAHEPTAQLIKNLAIHLSARVILAESTSSPWLARVVDHLRILLKTENVPVLLVSADHVDEEMKSVAHGSSHILVLAGVTMAGSVATRLCDTYELDMAIPKVSRAAIVCDAKDDVPGESISSGWLTTHKHSGAWHYLVNAPVPTYDASDWRVRAARISAAGLGNLNTATSAGSGAWLEGERLLDPISPSLVGLLDLWSTLGATPELRKGADETVAWRQPTRGVRYLPDLARLDPEAPESEFNDFDANWLAEAIIEGFCQLLGRAHRRDLVILSPEPKSAVKVGNGVDKVVDAMLHTRRVKAIRIPRASILQNRPLNIRDEEYIRVWKGASFVAFDEIAVSMKTLKGMSLLAKARGCPLDAVASLLDVGWPGRQEVVEPYFTLARWSHQAEVDPYKVEAEPVE